MTSVTTKTFKEVHITMSEKEAALLLLVLNHLGGQPDSEGKPLPRGLLDGWHELGHEASGYHNGLREQLFALHLPLVIGVEVTGYVMMEPTKDWVL